MQYSDVDETLRCLFLGYNTEIQLVQTIVYSRSGNIKLFLAEALYVTMSVFRSVTNEFYIQYYAVFLYRRPVKMRKHSQFGY